MSASRGVPFRWVLPVSQLVVCLILLWPLRGAEVLQFRAFGHSHWPSHFGQPVYYLSTTHSGSLNENRASVLLLDFRLYAPVALNFPCAYFGFASHAFVPAAVLRDPWRAVTWPVIGILFWWIAGRSIEAIAGAKRSALSPKVTWLEFAIALWLVALGIVLCVGFAIDPSIREDLIVQWQYALAGSVLWILLGLTIIAARIVQWRVRRLLQAQPTTGEQHGY